MGVGGKLRVIGCKIERIRVLGRFRVLRFEGIEGHWVQED